MSLRSHPLTLNSTPPNELVFVSKTQAFMHAPLGLGTCYLFHLESTSLSAWQNSPYPSKSSWKVTSFQPLFHLFTEEMFIAWLLLCQPLLCLSSMCSHDLWGKSLLKYLSHCNLIFSLPVFPIRLGTLGECNYALFISTQHAAHKRSSVNVYWLLTNNEEQLFGYACADLSPPDSWVGPPIAFLLPWLYSAVF